MRFLVLMTFYPGAGDALSLATVETGRTWAGAMIDRGALSVMEFYPDSGGYCVADVAGPDELTALLADCPLAPAIDFDCRVLVDLDEGFARMAKNILHNKAVQANAERSGSADLNRRPSGPRPDALPS